MATYDKSAALANRASPNQLCQHCTAFPKDIGFFMTHGSLSTFAMFAVIACSTILRSSYSQEAEVRPATTPSQVIDLLAAAEFESFDVGTLANRSPTSRELWRIDTEGRLRIDGALEGLFLTQRRFRNYHCVVEYSWSERTWGRRSERARSSGLLFHAHQHSQPPGAGVSDAPGGVEFYEVDLIEGKTGDIIFPARQTSITSKTSSDDWVDIKGFRGKEAIDNPVGEWNRLEVISRDSRITVHLNGQLINELEQLENDSGRIGLQSQLAECIVRRFELHPLGSFHEKWKPADPTTDMGYSISGESILPRRFPLTPEESLKQWQIDGDDYEIQLVAAEPITCDPVDVVWDEQGRMFVAEMGDYPTPASHPGYLSRIRLLSDHDGDGRMDHAVTWADELDHVQGLLPMQGGLLATTRTAILFLQDTNADGKADRREVLFRTNEPRHNQLQVSCPRWGMDNAIYLNNGLDGTEVIPESKPNQKISFTRSDLRLDPYVRQIQPITGNGQFGASFDDYGRRFFCSNRNPAMFAVMPVEAIRRNPQAGILTGIDNIQAPGASVWPLSLSHTTSSAHAGTHTSACGLAVYRSGVMSELNGNLFVCDPTAQLVTRNRIVPSGASFRAQRIGNKRDFLVSGDEWCRPVHVRNGPDGALYICDMYRRFIDHARFFPEEFQESHYMRAGLDHGRIWRLVPKGHQPLPGKPLPDEPDRLVRELESPIAWRRIHAQRLLVETARAHERVTGSTLEGLIQLLTSAESPSARIHAMWTLHGMGHMKEQHVLPLLTSQNSEVLECALLLVAKHFPQHPGVAERFSQLSDHPDDRIRYLAAIFAVDGQQPPNGADYLRRSPQDIWMRHAFASTFADQAPSTLISLLADPSFVQSRQPGHSETLEMLAMLVAAQGDLDGVKAAVESLDPAIGWPHFAVLNGLNSGLRKSRLSSKSLSALIARPPVPLKKACDQMRAILVEASTLVLDPQQPEGDRMAAMPLVMQQGLEKALPVVSELIGPNESSTIQAAACRSLSRFDRMQVAQFFFKRWKRLPPTSQREAIALLVSSPTTGLELMKRMKNGEIARSLMPPMTRWVYGRSNNQQIKEMAIELFGKGSGNRAAVIQTYGAALKRYKGDASRGREVFVKASCAQCHQTGGEGTEVGPSLNDVKHKPPEALLADILDPNRAVEQRWTAATILTADGQIHAGIVESDDASGVTLRMPLGIMKTVQREDIEAFTSTGKSLMPEGLELSITEQEMVDLIAFLKQR